MIKFTINRIYRDYDMSEIFYYMDSHAKIKEKDMDKLIDALLYFNYPTNHYKFLKSYENRLTKSQIERIKNSILNSDNVCYKSLIKLNYCKINENERKIVIEDMLNINDTLAVYHFLENINYLDEKESEILVRKYLELRDINDNASVAYECLSLCHKYLSQSSIRKLVNILIESSDKKFISNSIKYMKFLSKEDLELLKDKLSIIFYDEYKCYVDDLKEENRKKLIK